MTESDGGVPGIQVEMGQYHTLVCLEDGSVIFEAKDRAYDPAGTEDFFVIYKYYITFAS